MTMCISVFQVQVAIRLREAAVKCKKLNANRVPACFEVLLKREVRAINLRCDYFPLTMFFGYYI